MKFIEKLEENILSLLLVAMTLVVFIEVVARFMNTGVLWAQELTLLLSAWMVMFGASYCVKKGAHIGVDLVTNSLSDGWKRIVAIAAAALCIVYCLLVAWGGYTYIMKFRKIGLELEDIPVEKWKAYSFIVIATLLMSTRFAIIIKDNISGAMIGMKLTDEAEDVLELQEEGDAK